MTRIYSRAALALAALSLMILVPAGRPTHATSPAYVAGVWQDCTMYTLTPTSQSFLATGGSSNFFVDTGPGGGSCNWHARSRDSWITPDGSDQQGDKPLSYTVAVNHGDQRNGSIQILAVPGEGLVATFSVSQDGATAGVMTVCSADTPITATSSDPKTSTITMDQDLLIDHVSVSLFFTATGPVAYCYLEKELGQSIVIRLFSSDPSSSRILDVGASCGSACPPDCVFDSYRHTPGDQTRPPIDQALPPYVGQFQPMEQSEHFSDLDRTNARGTWRLRFGGGTLHCWCLRFYLARPGLRLLPVHAQIPIFSAYTARAFLTSQDGKPVPGQPVSFVVRGKNDELRFSEVNVSNDQGIADLVYGDFAPGDSLIEATAMIGGVRTGDLARVTWIANGFSGASPLAPFCPMDSATAGTPGAEATLGAARSFRDRALGRTQRGQRYTRLYYQFSSEAVRLMMFNPMLLVRSQEIIERYKPVIQSLADGEPVTVARGDLDEIDGFLNAFAEKGSPELQGAISSLRKDIRDPWVQAEFNITISDGPRRETTARSTEAVTLLFRRASILLTSFGLLFSCVLGIKLTGRRITRRGIKRCFCLTLGLVVSGQSQNASPAHGFRVVQRDTAKRAQANEVPADLPLFFEPNCGQADSKVKFLSRASGHGIFLTPGEAVMTLAGEDTKATRCRPQDYEPLPSAHPKVTTDVMRMKLVGADASARMTGFDELPGVSNYFIGRDPAGWRSNVHCYGRIKCERVYPGIDMVYYGNQREMEYDFIAAAGSDPGTIRLRFSGAESMTIDKDGDLVLGVAGRAIRQRKPLAYQEQNGITRIIPARYVIRDPLSPIRNQEVSFELGAYDRNLPLIIDPAFMYSTYFGGAGDDEGTTITVDQQGNAYVTGLTSSTNFPASAAEQPAFGGGQQDAFVVKLNPQGQLVYSTYLGGNGQDNGSAIAVDSAGNAYVTGFTGSTDFPVKNAMQPARRGRFNAFVAKLDGTGSLLYSTLLGGSVGDYGSSIAVDSSGNVYLAGVATSPDFPMVNAIQPAFGGAADVYVAKLDASGGRLLFSTYLGGSGNDGATSIAVDSTGKVYVTGVTTSMNFPTASPLQAAHGGGLFDAFVVKLGPSGNQLVYSTYLGGGGEDRAFRITADNAGNAYVTGDTSSTNFPTVNALQKSNGGGFDAFVAKLNPSGTQLVYSTYLGGSGIDGGTAISVDSAGNAYVTGFTNSGNFPTANALQQTYGGGPFDAFIAVLGPAGTTLDYSTYLGGNRTDAGFGIAMDSAGNAYVMGQTDSTDFPTANPLQPVYGGGASDVFMAKIKIGPLITGAQVSGKRLLVSGIGFDSGATILLNGDPQKTANDDQNPSAILVGRKAGKLINPGQTVTLQVRNADGSLSNQFSFTRP